MEEVVSNMHYTIDSLRSLLDSPIDENKWGEDTHTVSSLIRIIFSAGCSSCMFRRKISELKQILHKYGDTIGDNEYYIEQESDTTTDEARPEDSRIPCTDCVAKHLSQAYVLQSEFYQGYTEYIPLIEAHLNEAIEECPPGNIPLYRVLDNCLKSVIVDGKPTIPIVLATSLVDSYKVSSDTIDIDCKTIEVNALTNLIRATPPRRLIVLDRLISEMPTYTADSDIATKFDWYGRMALIADMIYINNPKIASEIRRRRLKYFNNPIPEDLDLIMCSDFLPVIKEEKAIRGIE